MQLHHCCFELLSRIEESTREPYTLVESNIIYRDTSRYHYGNFPSFSLATSALQMLLVVGCVNNRNELLYSSPLPYTNREGSDGQAR